MTQKLRKVIFVTFFIVFLSHLLESEGANKTRSKARAQPKLNETEARRFPLCVTYHMFEEYKANLPDGVKFQPFLKLNNLHHNRPPKGDGENIGRGIEIGSENGVIDTINYFRILADCPGENYASCRPMRQWVHIHLQTKRPVKGLIVQSITEPFLIPSGRFDIEFACQECKGEGIKPEKAKTGDALDLDGKAAVIPCDRRTYLHVRHPNVYAYASDTGRADFHFNFNWMDVTCRHMSKLQFMIFATEDWDVKKNKAEYFFTAAIDHIGVDSIDGMPYPWHPIWRNSMKCHVPDDKLPDAGANPLTQRSFKLKSETRWVMSEGGDKRSLDYDPAYDLCIRYYQKQPGGVPALPVHAQDPENNNTYFISRRMCSNIPQTKCNYSLPINDPNEGGSVGQPGSGSGSGTNPGGQGTVESEQDCTKGSCQPCTVDDNCFTNKLLRKLIRRDYVLQRIHGMAAILGLIAINVVNIHISRYFKEAGGCCMLVGWWLWAHLALSYISLGAVWVSLALVTSSERPRTVIRPDSIFNAMYSARECLLKVHKGIGFVAVIIFHIDFVFGAFRPISAMLRTICICVHASSGYIVVAIAAVAVFFSPACMDLVIFTFVMIGFSLIPWIVAFALQFVMDGKKKLNPKRKIFPVIEAVQVQPQLPMKIPRFILLALLIVVTVVSFFFVCYRGGRYTGWFVKSECKNCEYHYDEWIQDKVLKTKYDLMGDKFGCVKNKAAGDIAVFNARKDKFEKWTTFCEKTAGKGGSSSGNGGSTNDYDE